MTPPPPNATGRSWAAAVLALAVSLLLHVGLLRLNPDLFLGGGELPVRVSRPIVPDPVRLEAITVESRRELPELLERFGLLDPVALPEEVTPTVPEPEVADLEELTPALQGGDVAPLEPIQERLTLPEPESDWMPREEVLALRDARLLEQLEISPRMLRPDTAEIAMTRDILPPVELELLPPEPAAGDWGLPGAGGEAGRRRVDEIAATRPTRERLPLPELADLPDLTPPPLLREADPAIPDPLQPAAFQPVEQLLRLSAQAFVDPRNPDYRYFKVQLLPAGLERLPVMPREVVFLLDGSASMTQPMLREAAQGISAALDLLHPQDRVNLILFRETVEQLFPESQPADTLRIATVRGALAQARTFGRTDVFASLQALHNLPEQEGYTRIGVLVTDGIPTMGLTDSTEIIESFSRMNQGRSSVFGLGGGRQVNRFLLDFLSFRNRGDSLVAERNVQLPEAIRRIAAEIRRPVMTQLTYQFTGPAAIEVYPQSLTHLYLDRPLILVGRAPASQQAVAFQIVGQSQSGRHDMLYTLDLPSLPPGPWSLRQEWAWQALLHRVGEWIGHQDPQILAELRALSARYGLPIPHLDAVDGGR